MERPLQGADGRGDGAVQVRERRGGHDGRERRRVEAVVGVEHQRHVEGLREDVVGRLAVEHVEEVRGVREVFAWLDGVLAVADCANAARTVGILAVMRRALRRLASSSCGSASPSSGSNADIVDTPVRSAAIGFSSASASARTCDMTASSTARSATIDLVNSASSPRPGGVRTRGGGDLLVARALRQVLDGVAAVDELADVAVDVAQRRLGDEDTLEPFLEVV